MPWQAIGILRTSRATIVAATDLRGPGALGAPPRSPTCGQTSRRSAPTRASPGPGGSAAPVAGRGAPPRGADPRRERRAGEHHPGRIRAGRPYRDTAAGRRRPRRAARGAASTGHLRARRAHHATPGTHTVWTTENLPQRWCCGPWPLTEWTRLGLGLRPRAATYWGTAGVAPDAVSGTVLVWGLRPPATGAWATMTGDRADLGPATHITLQEWQASAGALPWVEPGSVAHACETPQVLQAAAAPGPTGPWSSRPATRPRSPSSPRRDGRRRGAGGLPR
jgi:hypothetical protein